MSHCIKAKRAGAHRTPHPYRTVFIITKLSKKRGEGILQIKPLWSQDRLHPRQLKLLYRPALRSEGKGLKNADSNRVGTLTNQTHLYVPLRIKRKDGELKLEEVETGTGPSPAKNFRGGAWPFRRGGGGLSSKKFLFCMGKKWFFCQNLFCMGKNGKNPFRGGRGLTPQIPPPLVTGLNVDVGVLTKKWGGKGTRDKEIKYITFPHHSFIACCHPATMSIALCTSPMHRRFI